MRRSARRLVVSPGVLQRTAIDPDEVSEWFDSIGVPLSDVYEGLSLTTPIATEFLIEAASGRSCVVRIVTSAYGSGADWENEFFAEMAATTIPIWDRLAALFAEAAAR